MEFNETTRVFSHIPPEKRASKTKSTAVGVGSVAIGFIVLKWFTPPCPFWLFVALLGFGAYSISGDLVRGFAGFVPAVIRDIRAAIKGNS